MPFRDAGYAPADFVLTIQDIVYGVWRAKEKKLLDIRSFNLQEYELYERVDQGDFNEIAPHFIAFASPQQSEYGTELNYPFLQVLDYFVSHDVQLVVRLNSHLYDKTEFEKRGVKHIDLMFDDGTCPTMDFVQAFIGAVEGVISQKGKVAVHCKAGLGRTGCLIGAHLIYTYGFTAAEVIAYMRFLRPGMVVGPQQHWLYLHQNDFRDWRRTMTVSRIASEKLAGFCPLVPRSFSTYPLRSPSGPQRRMSPRTPERSIINEVNHANSALPVPTPGQPRKYSPTPAGRSKPRNPSPMARRYVPSSIGQINSDDDGDNDDDDDDVIEEKDLNQAFLDDEEEKEAEYKKSIIYDDNRDREDPNDDDTLDEEIEEVEKPTSQPANPARSRSSSNTGDNIQITKRTSNGVLRSHSRRISAANVTPSGSPERRKPSMATSIVADIFGDEENVAYDGDEDDYNVVASNGGVGKRNVTDSLSQKQQILMRQQLRANSNQPPQRTRPSNRTASFQMISTTTTTTTTTTLSSSPPTATATIDANGVLRRPNRVISGVRKTSGGSPRAKR
ncbi:hypothetical protein D0Z03_002928 [Geotrichum reessii]|nr:hypothetical protein D0Z03_002928 [Galactomyces reessii]